jgi:hypothetical protein
LKKPYSNNLEIEILASMLSNNTKAEQIDHSQMLLKPIRNIKNEA